MKPRTKEKKPSTALKINAQFNHKKNTEYMINSIMSGPNGVFIAMREAVNNSLDAGATDIRISVSVHEGIPALIIEDNGSGFNKKNIDSVMSYGYSSRKREDLTSIGTNGTGIKTFLALGSFDRTKITIYSVSKEMPECTKMELTFEYVLSLAKQDAKPGKHVHTVPIPPSWNSKMKRATGATLILTGYDGRKMKNAKQIITEFAQFLTPRAVKLIRIYDGHSLKEIAPAEFNGSSYELSLNTPKLGNVEFEIFYGGSGEGPVICGKINAIMSLTDLYRRLSPDQKRKMSKIWKTVSGHIYIEKANMYREHDNSFLDDFYSSNACGELLEILNVVSEELEKLDEAARDAEAFKKKKDIINNIIEAGKLVSPPILNQSNSLSMVAGPASGAVGADVEVYIVPKIIRIYTNKSETVVLTNKGNKTLNFDDAAWVSEDPSMATILEIKGGMATIKAGKNPGTTNVIITGSFGKHVMEVRVSKSMAGPFIIGPSYINPGERKEYELKQHEGPVVWSLEESNKGISLIADPTGKKKVSIEASLNCRDSSCILVARDSKKQVLAQKKVNVVENENRARNNRVIRIGEENYLLSVDTYYPEILAQVDTSFTDGLPSIVINPIHARVKNMGTVASIDAFLVSIAFAAVIHQSSEGKLNLVQAGTTAEKFISDVRQQLLNLKK